MYVLTKHSIMRHGHFHDLSVYISRMSKGRAVAELKRLGWDPVAERTVEGGTGWVRDSVKVMGITLWENRWRQW